MQKIEGFFGGFLSFLFVIFIEISNFINAFVLLDFANNAIKYNKI